MPKVLLIEDDALILNMYQKAFSLAGIEIDIATNGQAGIDKARIDQPDLILLDVMMPVMNGLEVIKKLKADSLTNPIPVIMLTNIAEFQIVNRAIAAGAIKYIVKSDTEPEELIKLVKDLFGLHSA